MEGNRVEAIVVGTDGSDTAKLAVEEAVCLVNALRGELHIVSAYEPRKRAHDALLQIAAEVDWAPAPDSQVNSILDEAAAAARIGGRPHLHARYLVTVAPRWPA